MRYIPAEYTWYQEVSGPQSIKEVVTFTADRHGRRMEEYKGDTLVESLSNINDGIVSFYHINLAEHPTFARNDGAANDDSRVSLQIFPDGTFIPLRSSKSALLSDSMGMVMYPKEKLSSEWKGFVPSTRLLDYLFPLG